MPPMCAASTKLAIVSSIGTSTHCPTPRRSRCSRAASTALASTSSVVLSAIRLGTYSGRLPPFVFRDTKPEPAWMMSSKAGLSLYCPSCPEPGGHAVNQARIQCSHGLIAEAQPLDGGHAHVVHEHVRLRDQVPQRCDAFLILEVEHDRALVPVQRQVDGAHSDVLRHTVGTHHVAFWAFDLDHVGAQVREYLGRKGPENDRSQVQYANAIERATAWGALALPVGHSGWGCHMGSRILLSAVNAHGTRASGAPPSRPRPRGNPRCGTARAGSPTPADWPRPPVRPVLRAGCGAWRPPPAVPKLRCPASVPWRAGAPVPCPPARRLVFRFIKTITLCHLKVEGFPLESNGLAVHFVDAFENTMLEFVK